MSWYEWSSQINRLSNTMGRVEPIYSIVNEKVYICNSILNLFNNLLLIIYLSNNFIGQFII
jgi:hypothetical protein